MAGKREKSRLVSWSITLGVFVLLQLFFIAIDGTVLEPTRFNDSDDIGGRIIQSELFTERITPYSNPSLNVATTFIVVVIALYAMKDLIFSVSSR